MCHSMKRAKKPETEAYKIRLPKDVIKAVRVRALAEDRTILNMMTVLIKSGLERRGV